MFVWRSLAERLVLSPLFMKQYKMWGFFICLRQTYVSYLKFFLYLNERYCVNLVSVCVILLDVNSSFIYTSWSLMQKVGCNTRVLASEDRHIFEASVRCCKVVQSSLSPAYLNYVKIVLATRDYLIWWLDKITDMIFQKIHLCKGI